MKEAIQKSMDAGYIPEKLNFSAEWSSEDVENSVGVEVNYQVDKNKCLLDPIFWQCLGKSLGWDDDSDPMIAITQVNDGWRWLRNWHNLIDHLAEGKDPEDFFTSLLANK